MLTVTDIPLNRLVPSPANVRRTGSNARVDELAASIEAHGLLQNLTVRPAPAKRKSAKGERFEVVAGGRRLAALKVLAKREVIAADAPVRCQVLDCENAFEISLAENALQCPMHPADQFEAFFKLHSEDGMSAEDIAARFGVTAAVVKQRLKLAALSPALMQAYRNEQLNLDQLTAFAITDDHAKQEAVLERCDPNTNRETILDALTEEHIAADDRRVQFVGLDTYQAAGGAMLRDLFDDEGGGFLTDPDLINRLATEKLEAVAETVHAEGWKWVVVRMQQDYGTTADMRRVYPEPRDLSEEEQATLDALEAEYNEAIDVEDGDFNQAEIDRIESAIATLQGEDVYDAAVIARAGVIVFIGHDGEPRIERGYIRREDESRPASDRASSANGGPAPLAASLVAELTAYRTLGLQDALGQQPETALVTVIHALAAQAFFPNEEQVSCLEIMSRSLLLGRHASGIDDSATGQQIAARHEAWARRMPEAPEGLWAFVVGLRDDDRLALLAHCASLTLDAVQRPHASNPAALAHADQVAEAVHLDMRAHWQPTAKGYFGRIGKERILDAVREGVSAAAADNLTKLKKGALAEAAEQRLQGRGWLPPLLRGSEDVSPTIELAEAA